LGVGVLWGYGNDKKSLILNSDYVISEIGNIECLKLN
jgi:hypothetical protein